LRPSSTERAAAAKEYVLEFDDGRRPTDPLSHLDRGAWADLGTIVTILNNQIVNASLG
jgi:hypothetical protein